MVWFMVAMVSAHGPMAPLLSGVARQRRDAYLRAGRKKRWIERQEGAWPRLWLWLRG